MKEIMLQYGQSVIAVIVAVLLFAVIGGNSGEKGKGIYVQTGQLVNLQNCAEKETGNLEFEQYWRQR